jgi:ATP-dependent DNA helicase DinG|tara:strand:- start:169 stop:2073 length:1905 start_codon:yes stop_codon:yes gene_type:complete
VTELYHYFGKDGFLTNSVSGFVVREQQVAMARVVEQSIKENDVAFLEAGTGTGKTFAYLVPIFLSDKKTIISTGTKTLQDQLRFQDLPLLGKLFPKTRIALLKGRSNYLCPHRLQKHLKVLSTDKRTLARLVDVQSWALTTTTGDLGEVSEIDDRLLPFITSTKDNCLGSACPQFEICPLYTARQRAVDADVIVVNHHLLFADMVLKEESVAAILPNVGVVVVDEAHQIPEIARQFFGASINSRRFVDLIRDLRSEMFLLGNDDPQLLGLVAQLESAISKMVKLIFESGADYDHWFSVGGQHVVEDVDHCLADLMDMMHIVSVRSQGMESCRRRVEQLADDFVLLTEPTNLEDYIHWIDKSAAGFNVHLSPINIADNLGQLFYSEDTAWIFSSATLCVDGNFEHIKQALGVPDATEKRFASPFDFGTQVRACLPPDLPAPGNDAHTEQLVQAVLPLFRENKGRSFFLFTSYRAMNFARDLLHAESLPIFVQGSMTRQALLQAFRETKGSILLATHSFWQGVDVRGAALTCVIIDKLPFASPEEPLPKATMQAIEAAGGNGFVDYLLPQAIISLNQGFGRLIRSETDRGLFVLGDPRIRNRSYGNVVMASLPKMPWVDIEVAGRYLREISEPAGV